MLNPFNKKKTPYQQMTSVFSPGYTRATQAQTTTTPTKTPYQQMTSVFSPGYTQATQAQATTTPAAPTSNVIPGSGMTSQYQNNPMNQQQRQAPPPPPPVTGNPTSQGSNNPFLDRLQDLVRSQSQSEQQRAVSQAQRLEEMKQAQNQAFQQAQDRARSRYGEYEQAVRGSVAGQEQATADQIQEIEEYTGQNLRQQAEARRQSQSQVQGVFANLGTLDSSAFQNAMVNQDNEATRRREGTLSEQGRDVRAVQRQLTQFKQDTEAQMLQARYQLEDDLANIDQNLTQGTLQYNQAIEDAYARADSTIQGLEMQYYQTAAQMSQAGTNDMSSQLSDEFLRTGVPQNRADYMYKMEKGVTQTPAQKAVDTQFAKTYEEYVVSGGYADAEKGLKQLREAKELIKDAGVAFGPITGSMPEINRTALFPNAVNAEEKIKEVVQRNLRVILGAQFTEKEGELLMARAFNPKLGLKENLDRLDNLYTQMQQAAQAKEAATRYFEQNGTLTGFTGKLFTIQDIDPTSATSQDRINEMDQVLRR